MATRTKSIEYAYDTGLANVATNTTLGTSTRFDTTALTLYIPESSVTFKSVIIEATFRDAFTANRTISAWRLGIKLGAVAFDDGDFSPSGISTAGDHQTMRLTRDVTSYFVTNWSGTSMTSQVGVVISTAAADNVNNITTKLRITYTYDDTSGTHVKTVRIPIQSETTTISTSAVEIGTSGTNAAPANQIPLLDDFLPEDSVVIRRAWIEISATNGTNGTTDIQLSVQIDSAGASARAVLEMGLSSSAYFLDYFPYDTATFATSAAHAFKVLSSVATTFPCIGAVLYVTYEFDPASSRILNSIMLPIDFFQHPYTMDGTTAADGDTGVVNFQIPEPGTITLLQSGVLWRFCRNTSGSTINALTGSASARGYIFPASLIYSGIQTVIHRVDQNSGIAIAGGDNTLTWVLYSSAVLNVATFGGWFILNYSSDAHPDGPGVHNATTFWDTYDYPASGSQTTGTTIRTVANSTPEVPVIGAHYYINGVGFDAMRYFGSAGGILLNISHQLEQLSGEIAGSGWFGFTKLQFSGSEIGNYDVVIDNTELFNRTDQAETTLMDIEGVRRYQAITSAYVASFMALTHHECSYVVSGTVSGYSIGDGSGIIVDVFDDDTGVRVASATTAAGGSYTAEVYDATRTYFAEARQDNTHVGRSANVTPT